MKLKRSFLGVLLLVLGILSACSRQQKEPLFSVLVIDQAGDSHWLDIEANWKYKRVTNGWYVVYQSEDLSISGWTQVDVRTVADTVNANGVELAGTREELPSRAIFSSHVTQERIEQYVQNPEASIACIYISYAFSEPKVDPITQCSFFYPEYRSFSQPSVVFQSNILSMADIIGGGKALPQREEQGEIF